MYTYMYVYTVEMNVYLPHKYVTNTQWTIGEEISAQFHSTEI